MEINDEQLASMMEDLTHHAADKARTSIADTAQLANHPAHVAGVIVAASVLVLDAAVHMIEVQKDEGARNSLSELLINTMGAEPSTFERLEKLREWARKAN